MEVLLWRPNDWEQSDQSVHWRGVSFRANICRGSQRRSQWRHRLCKTSLLWSERYHTVCNSSLSCFSFLIPKAITLKTLFCAPFRRKGCGCASNPKWRKLALLKISQELTALQKPAPSQIIFRLSNISTPLTRRRLVRTDSKTSTSWREL